MTRVLIGVCALSTFCASMGMERLAVSLSICDLKAAEVNFSSRTAQQHAGALFDVARKSDCPIEALHFLSKQYARQSKHQGAETFALAVNNQRGPGYYLRKITHSELYKAHM